MGTEGTMLNEKCQTRKDKYHIISHMDKKKKELIEKQVSQACGYQKQGQGRKMGDRKLVEDGKHIYSFNDN